MEHRQELGVEEAPVRHYHYNRARPLRFPLDGHLRPHPDRRGHGRVPPIGGCSSVTMAGGTREFWTHLLERVKLRGGESDAWGWSASPRRCPRFFLGRHAGRPVHRWVHQPCKKLCLTCSQAWRFDLLLQY